MTDTIGFIQRWLDSKVYLKVILNMIDFSMLILNKVETPGCNKLKWATPHTYISM